MTSFDSIVVGAGLAGATLAERLAAVCGHRVLVVERRGQVAGNAYDYVDAHGVLCHRFGPHAFHTNSERIVAYLSRFTAWHPYEHRVAASLDHGLVPMPVNRDTLNAIFGTSLRSPQEAEAFLATHAVSMDAVRTSEDAVVSRMGHHLYRRLFRDYSRKHWGLDPADLDASVCARIPVRFDTDDRYFTDWFQALPDRGYTHMVKRMLSHPNIEIAFGVDFAEIASDVRHREWLVYTGSIDEHFGYRLGRLPYRGVRIDFRTTATPGGELLQPLAQINYPDAAVPFTRTTEFRHMTGQVHTASTVAVEAGAENGEPCYPIPAPANRALYRRYAALAAAEPRTVFVGRLARYQYLNMDQVVGQALARFATMVGAQPRDARTQALALS